MKQKLMIIHMGDGTFAVPSDPPDVEVNEDGTPDFGSLLDAMWQARDAPRFKTRDEALKHIQSR